MYAHLYPVKDPSSFYILHSFRSISNLELVVAQISMSIYTNVALFLSNSSMK